jgi:hypothetical protein
MAGDMISIDVSQKRDYTVLDLKRVYIKEEKEEINEDKLVLLDSNNVELCPNDKKLKRYKNLENLSAFVIPSYIDKNCLKMKEEDFVSVSYENDITCIKNLVSHQELVSETIFVPDIGYIDIGNKHIYTCISEYSLPLDRVSYFSIRHEMNDYRDILLCLSYFEIRFGKVEDTYSFKYDPFKNRLFYVSKGGIVKSVICKPNRSNNVCIQVKFENPRVINSVYLRECTRNEVEKIERNF